jgi:hypothetical protein
MAMTWRGGFSVPYSYEIFVILFFRSYMLYSATYSSDGFNETEKGDLLSPT